MIILENVSKTYEDGAGTKAIRDVNLTIHDGEFVFIVGDSGSGKTTLIKLLLGEEKPSSGNVLVDGENVGQIKARHLPKYRRRFGVVFQDFRLLRDRNVYENVAFAQRVVVTPTRVIKKRVPEVLSLVGLQAKYRKYPKKLSGGEKQRVALARALVNNPLYILADEPTGNLDPKNSEEVMRLLQTINESGTTVIVVTHDVNMVNLMKKRVVTMHKGSIISDVQEGACTNEN